MERMKRGGREKREERERERRRKRSDREETKIKGKKEGAKKNEGCGREER